MTSLKQIEANRRNAQNSTGPRTEAGKQRSSRNAVRHGLTAETVIGPLEDAEDYQRLTLCLFNLSRVDNADTPTTSCEFDCVEPGRTCNIEHCLNVAGIENLSIMIALIDKFFDPGDIRTVLDVACSSGFHNRTRKTWLECQRY